MSKIFQYAFLVCFLGLIMSCNAVEDEGHFQVQRALGGIGELSQDFSDRQYFMHGDEVPLSDGVHLDRRLHQLHDGATVSSFLNQGDVAFSIREEVGIFVIYTGECFVVFDLINQTRGVIPGSG